MNTSESYSHEEKVHRTSRIRRLLLLSFLTLFILLVILMLDGSLNRAWSLYQAGSENVPPSRAFQNWNQLPKNGQNRTSDDSLTAAAMATRTGHAFSASARPTGKPSPTSTTVPSQVPPVQIEFDSPFNPGTIYLSLFEANGKHLFAYNPQKLPFTRLTAGNWDDITPSASPDGTRLAFSSNRDGQWDLYVMDLQTGAIQRVTTTPEYDASPSWSPDSQWLVYETYTHTQVTPELQPAGEPQEKPGTGNPMVALENLEIFILQVGTAADPVRLSNHPATDFAPVWSPAGRQIAFVSNRTGEHEIWIADLDRFEDRFQNISNNPASADKFPAWSPDGSRLAWSATQAGYQNIFFKYLDQQSAKPQILGVGERPVWSPANNALIAFMNTPNRTYLTGYVTDNPGLALPSISLPGFPEGLTWSPAELSEPLPDPMQQSAQALIVSSWESAKTPVSGIPGGRQRVVELEDTEAPYPMLSDLVDESFYALRSSLVNYIGWDYLSSLESAFIPLTSPLFPGLLSDWLYTGRAIALNPAPINAEWMLVMREEFGSETYWRVYLKARYQDGTQGRPLYDPAWNLNARYDGDPRHYEDGGSFTNTIPSGYWFDFTQLAASLDWQRLPALVTWRSALPAARFNEFAFTDGLDWLSAMSELYPVEALHTPTPVLPPTFTPTATRWPTRTPLPTRTPWPTRTPSPTPAIP
ncbi:MAG TPA: hypothetical protein VLA49_03170 [Anaerolineales bacterium]|nr:hypothetical protein [Anaerolineales bacterium]